MERVPEHLRTTPRPPRDLAMSNEPRARAEERLCNHGELAVARVTSCTNHRSNSRGRGCATRSRPGEELAGRTDFALGVVTVPDGVPILVAYDPANPRHSTVYFITA